MPRILACGGGSLGHLVPIIAVCQALRNLSPSVQISVACTERPEEAEYLRTTHLPFTPLPTPRRTWSFPQTFYKSYRAAQHLLTTFQPEAILSRGGAISVPLCLAATRNRLPIILHESDARMGWATCCIAWRALSVTTGFPSEAYPRIFRSRLTFTGNPTRAEITKGSREEGLRITGLSGKRPILLVLGGSKGAQFFNNLITHSLEEILCEVDVVHLTGKGKPGAEERRGYWKSDVVYDQLPHLYALATIALSRAGASNLSELAANGIPSVIVPLRGVAHDHQWHNAQVFANHHACLLIEQGYLPTQLLPQLRGLLATPLLRFELARNIRTFHPPDASRQIAEIVLRTLA